MLKPPATVVYTDLTALAPIIPLKAGRLIPHALGASLGLRIGTTPDLRRSAAPDPAKPNVVGNLPLRANGDSVQVACEIEERTSPLIPCKSVARDLRLKETPAYPEGAGCGVRRRAEGTTYHHCSRTSLRLLREDVRLVIFDYDRNQAALEGSETAPGNDDNLVSGLRRSRTGHAGWGLESRESITIPYANEFDPIEYCR